MLQAFVFNVLKPEDKNVTAIYPLSLLSIK